MSIVVETNQPFNESFQSGLDISDEHYLPVAIGERSYVVDVRAYKRATMPSQRQQFDSQAEPSEASLSSIGSWRRLQTSWQHGAGQEDYDFDQRGDRERFFESKGVDVLGHDGVRLLPETASHISFTTGNAAMRLLYAHGRVYVSRNDTLSWVDPGAPAAAATVIGNNGSTGTITSLTTDGFNVYVARGSSGIWKVGPSDTQLTQLTVLSTDEVGFANDRLLALSGHVIKEISAAGTHSEVGLLDYSHPNTAFEWRSPVPTPFGILLAGGVGEVFSLYLIGLQEDGSLAPPRLVAPMPHGEQVVRLHAYVNFVAIGTNLGFRIGQFSNQNSLQYGPLVETPGPVRAIAGRGEFLYLGWSNDADSGLVKVDLSRSPQPGLYAWARDVYANAVNGPVSGVVVAPQDGRTFFAIEGSGLYHTTDNLVELGELTSSWVTFGTSELKIGRFLSLRHDALDGIVDAYLQPDNGVLTSIGRSEAQGAFGPTRAWQVDLQKFHRQRYVLRLSRSATDATKGPNVRHVSLSAFPTPSRVERFEVPILLFSKVVNHQGDGAEIFMDTLGEFSYLKGLEESKELVVYREGSITETVFVDGVEMSPIRWNDDSSFFEGICTVQLFSSAP